MKLFFHDINSQHQNSGGLYYYGAISRILRDQLPSGVTSEPFNYFDLLLSDTATQRAFAQNLSASDCVVVNCGPYAAFFHAMREQHDRQFRIIRDVQTSTWAGYLCQEALSVPMQRPGDRVIFPSFFARRYFEELFSPEHYSETAVVAHPIHHGFPAQAPMRVNSGLRRIGYLGRVSDDRNWPQTLDQFIALYKTDPRQRLVFAGPIDTFSNLNTLEKMHKRLARHGIPKDALDYKGWLPYEQIWSFFSEIDVFVFPALSNVETLGRVILEAQHMGVPVVSTAYAAAGELLPDTNLCQPVYTSERWFKTNGTFSFGSPDADDFQRAVNGAVHDDSPIHRQEFSDAWMRSVLFVGATNESRGFSADYMRDFMTRLDWRGLTRFNAQTALDACTQSMPKWQSYCNQRLGTRISNAFLALRDSSVLRDSKIRAAQRLIRPKDRQMLGNAREYCVYLNFEPEVCLHATP